MNIYCPLCGAAVLVSADPDFAINAHIEQGCRAIIVAGPAPAAPASSGTAGDGEAAALLGTHRCRNKGCRRQELSSRVCTACNNNFCATHIRAHHCTAGAAGPPAKRRPAIASSDGSGSSGDRSVRGGSIAAANGTSGSGSSGSRRRRRRSPDIAPHPRLLVLDLDQTLWPFDAAQPRYGLPHRSCSGGSMATAVRCVGATATPFDEALAVVRRAGGNGWRIAVASANSKRNVCESLLRHLGLLQTTGDREDGIIGEAGKFDSGLLEIYPGSKKTHFERLAESSGIGFSQMLFFDDRPQNIRAAQELGVVAVLVDPLIGLTEAAFARGCSRWRAQQQGAVAMANWLQHSSAE